MSVRRIGFGARSIIRPIRMGIEIMNTTIARFIEMRLGTKNTIVRGLRNGVIIIPKKPEKLINVITRNSS